MRWLTWKFLERYRDHGLLLLRASAGAGFVVAKTGAIMTMPGLGPVPSAMNVDLVDGVVSGLF